MSENFDSILNDPERIAAIERLNLIDSPPEIAFDRLTRIAARLLRVPVSLFSVVGADRQYFKSQIGLEEPQASERNIPLSHSFCRYVVGTGEALIVENAPVHPLVYDNLAISDLGVVAYAGMPITAPNGELIGSFCIIDNQPRIWTADELVTLRDLAELVKAEVELRWQLIEVQQASRTLQASQENMRRITDNMLDMLLQTDMEGNIKYASSSTIAVVGYVPDTLIGMSIYSWSHPEDMYLLVSAAKRGVRIEHRWLHANGSYVWLETVCNLLLVNDELDIEIIFTSRDITERKRAERELHVLYERQEYQARHDSLTGLANRAHFEENLRTALDYGKTYAHPVGVLFVDLDRFKLINDTLGHAAGDELLIQVAERLTEIVDQGDVVGRMGGDEFAIVTVRGEAHAESIAQRIVQSFNEPFRLSSDEVTVTTSVGISLFPRDGSIPDELLRKADNALYVAKMHGKNMYQMYTAEMHASETERLRLESQLRKALPNREFMLVYQPQISIATNDIASVEALLRWNHPDLGLLLPSRFINIAEESGLIVPIGEWILEEACRQCSEWMNAGQAITVSVNISAVQFRRPNFVDAVMRTLDRWQLPPGFLELELTESVLMYDIQDAVIKLQRLREVGIRLAIDDFGVGYSSLSYLQRMPLHKLKIDHSFVHEIGTDDERGARSEAVVQAIITIAHTLGMVVVAEGVETVQQLNYLRRIGCDGVQGYIFSTPLTALELINRLPR
jgi:diguanylate cyclase (GGDEF)-like protein/PAS domain S-box-containing protein